ncbi:MAG: hypothetical protein QNJ19_10600 [Woeseiaceae bacterium]|nr:hypothetical protein [Woeseiaceae bacterium]
MTQNMTKWCCGPDGTPDFNKMTEFMERHDRTSKYDAAGWALFFIWVGVAWLAGFSLGVGLLGVAAITLGMQAIRKASGVPVEGFWVLVGIGFAVAGLWQGLDVQLPLAPFVLIGAGIALFLWRVWPKNSRQAK